LADREVTAPAEAATPSTLLRASPEGEWDRNREAETSAHRSGNPSAENGPASSREHASIPLSAILGEVDPSVSQVQATSPHRADGVDAATIAVTVTDSLGNGLPDQTVWVVVGGTENVIDSSPGNTDANGVFTATLTSTRAEAKAIHVLVGDGLQMDWIPDTPIIVFTRSSILSLIHI